MEIRPLISEADYDAALQAIEPDFDRLSRVIAEYEARQWPIEPPAFSPHPA